MDSATVMRETLAAARSTAAGTWALVWATWAVFVAAAAYALLTLAILWEQVRVRREQATPFLAPRLKLMERPFQDRMNLFITNYGQGHAVGLEAVLHFLPGDDMRFEIRATGIRSQEDYPVLMPDGTPPLLMHDNLTSKREAMRLVGTCKDLTGRRHKIDIRVPVREGSVFPGQAIIGEMLDRQRAEQEREKT